MHVRYADLRPRFLKWFAFRQYTVNNSAAQKLSQQIRISPIQRNFSMLAASDIDETEVPLHAPDQRKGETRTVSGECGKGLEIVVPKRFSASRVPSLVEKNSQWIERAFQKAKAFQGLISPVPVWQMPEEI